MDETTRDQLYEMAVASHREMATRSEAFHIVGEDIEINHEPETSDDEIPSADAIFLILVCILALMAFVGLVGVAALNGWMK